MKVEAKSEDTQMAGAGVEPEKESFKKAVVEEEEKKESETTKEEVYEETDVAKTVVEEEEKIKEPKEAETSSSSTRSFPVQKSSSFKEESNFLSDLKENEKKALFDLRAKVEEAILENKLFKKAEEEKDQLKEEEGVKKEEEENSKEEEKEKIQEQPTKEEEEEEENSKVEEKEKIQEQPTKENEEEEENSIEKTQLKEISLWGVPLLPSKGSESTNVVLLKFLRARDFKENEAFLMLKNTLQWRKETRIDSILEEDALGSDLRSAAYMDGADREGHPVCYNVNGVFQDDELYQKTFGTEEKTENFLRWRFQLMEKGIQKLDFKPDGVSSILQIIDLKNSPGLSKKELRAAMKRAVGLLQDNYPELVTRNIFINVPFWYYAFSAFLSPFLTQRTTSKFVFARPARVTETLLKYIPAEDIPTRYGGLKRENDSEFSVKDGGVSELFVKSGSAETVEIPAPEVGITLLWDLTVVGWEVNYKEEFVPTDEGSYTIIVQKGRKLGAQEEPVRNSFRSNEPGKVVLTIENNTFRKKRVLYRYKMKNCA